MNIKEIKKYLKEGKTIYDIPLKVVYYARVSTEKDDQINSLENQKNYFEDYIKNNKNWIYKGKYIDEGISGTSVKNRIQFQKMIEDSKEKRFDLILTKEISRFSRNTLDSIKYTELLYKEDVIVYFISDNLNTIDEDSELRLTIMASLAQEEVRKLSERVKFGINRMIKDRKLLGSNLTGYIKKNGKYKINKKTAPMIKYIFETYVTEKYSLKEISKNLANMGYLNKKGKNYSQTTLKKIITNPRYKGYYTAKLSEIENYKTHKKIKLPKEKQIIEKNKEIPIIINEELWNKANIIYERNRLKKSRNILNSNKTLNNSKYTRLIYCHNCNEIFVRCGGSNREDNPTWVCKTYKTQGVKSCSSPIIKEKILDKILIEIFTTILPEKNRFQQEILSQYSKLIIKTNQENIKKDLSAQLNQINNKKEELLDLKLDNLITTEEFIKKNNDLETTYNKTLNELDQINKNITNDKSNILKKIDMYLSEELTINNYLNDLIKLFIKKIEIEKINNNRKNIKIIIYFSYNNKILIKNNVPI